MSVTNFYKICIHRLLPNVILLVVLSILLSLGFWQLHRAAEKNDIIEHFATEQRKASTDWNHQVVSQFAKVVVDGHRLPTTFYLDNQFYKHQIGYHVLVPIEDKWGRIIMVDLGWVSALGSRTTLPKVTLPSLEKWQGQVYYPKLSKVNLGHFVDKKMDNNYVIESMDLTQMAKLMHRQVQPWVLRIKAGASEFIQDWPIVSVQPERHYGYALQWFLMAAVIFIIMIWRWKK